jgi:hypothetical protein
VSWLQQQARLALAGQVLAVLAALQAEQEQVVPEVLVEQVAAWA